MIPCFNAAATLRDTLCAVDRLEGRSELDVIVVDNGSTDGSAAVAAAFDGVTVEHCRRRGVGHARNRGLELARTPVMLTLDADCVPRSDWAMLLCTALDRAPADVVAVAGRTLPRPHSDRWSQRWEITPHPGVGCAGALLYAVAGNACYRTEMVAGLGGFPPFGADDAAFGVLARRTGLRFASEPTAVVEHANPTGARGYLHQMLKIGRYTGQLEPESIGGWRWWAGRCRQAAGAFRAEDNLTARVVCATASFASAMGAVQAARDPDRPTFGVRTPLASRDRDAPAR